MDNKKFLREMCELGAQNKKVNLEDSRYKERLEMELKVILDNDLESFFLDNSFIINSLKREGVFFGPGRGSAGGCLVSFLLNITVIDPVYFNLPFSRFLNEARVKKGALPDIDVDIQKSKRQKAIKFIKDNYGNDRVFGVSNFVQYSLKVAIKDISRVFGIPFDEVNPITKQISDETTLENIEEIPVVHDFFNKYPIVKEYLPKVYQLNKNHGKHAGAIIIFPGPVYKYMSTNKVRKDILTCYDKKLENIGYLKLDLLGIETLDVISDTLKMVNAKLPDFRDFNDKKVFETINNSPLGVFQLEKNAGVKYLSQVKIESFEDLYNALALIRPGSVDSGETDKYIERKKDRSKVEYEHPDLESILKDNLGTVIFQEDLMAISQKFGGFSEIKADDLRKAIGKKMMDLMMSLEKDFISGGLSLDYDETLLKSLWNKMEAAGNYSFNKSHAVGYAFLSYFCGWLKTYYPIEFLISVANHSDDEKRVKVFNEIKNLNIKISNPNINKSDKDIFIDEDKNVLLGLSQIDGVGDKAIASILSKRPYYSFSDFMKKRPPRQVNVRVVKSLIESGAFDCFNEDRCSLYNIIDTKKTHNWSKQEILLREYKRLKLSPNQNLIDFYKDEIKDVEICPLNQIPEDDFGEIYIRGLVNSFVVKEAFNILEINDGTQTKSLFVSNEVKNKYFDELSEVGTPLLIKCSQYKKSLSLDFLINLTNKNDSKFKKQMDYIEKDYTKYLKPEKSRCVIKKIFYFKSKKNKTPCLRIFGISGDGEIELFMCNRGSKKIPKDLEVGDLIVFTKNGNFCQTITVV